MPEVRAAALAMVARGELEVTQRGRVVDDSARGAIRLRLAPHRGGLSRRDGASRGSVPLPRRL